MEKDEELGMDRGFDFETDDEENEADCHLAGDDSLSSSPSPSPSPMPSINVNEDEMIQASWPQSYRQSIDQMSSVLSPNVGLLTENLMRFRGSSLHASTTSIVSDDIPTSIVEPLIRSASDIDNTASIPIYASVRSKSSFMSALPPRQCSAIQSIFNGINVLCGVGLLATPFALREGGWLSIVLLFVNAILSFFTMVLLKRCLDSTPGIQTYPDIGQAAFGRSGRLFISVILYIELYACCVEYITLMSNSLESLSPHTQITILGVHLNPHQLFAVGATLVALPTVWLRDLSLLSYLSAGGVIATILVVICLFWVGLVDRVGFHPGGNVLNLSNLPVALGLYGFCYSGHSVFPNIYSSMKTRAQFPFVLVSCYAICTILYFGVALMGYLTFGDLVKSQFTLNMPPQYLSSKVAILTTVVNPLSKYALTMNPVALSLEELLPPNKNYGFIGLFIRTILVLSTLVVGLAVPFFGYVMALLGSLFAMLVTLIIPCACYLRIHRRSVKLPEVIVCILISTAGLACACIGSYSSIKQIIDHLG